MFNKPCRHITKCSTSHVATSQNVQQAMSQRPDRQRKDLRTNKLIQTIDTENAKHQRHFDAEKAAHRLTQSEIDAGPRRVDAHFYSCKHCGQLTTDHEDTFGTRDNLDRMYDCSACNGWIHADCMGFGRHMHSRFQEQETWLCLLCRPTKNEPEVQDVAEEEALNVD